MAVPKLTIKRNGKFSFTKPLWAIFLDEDKFASFFTEVQARRGKEKLENLIRLAYGAGVRDEHEKAKIYISAARSKIT